MTDMLLAAAVSENDTLGGRIPGLGIALNMLLHLFLVGAMVLSTPP